MLGAGEYKERTQTHTEAELEQLNVGRPTMTDELTRNNRNTQVYIHRQRITRTRHSWDRQALGKGGKQQYWRTNGDNDGLMGNNTRAGKTRPRGTNNELESELNRPIK